VGGLAEYVFGYGSLAGDLAPAGRVARLDGYRRRWGVAADNAHAIPGYKQYRLRSDGSVPSLFIAFLDLVEAPGQSVNGVMAVVDSGQLAELDRRERNYDRIDVTASIDSAADGRVWTYVGSAAGRERYADGAARDRLAISGGYLESVDRAFRSLGDAEHAAFLSSSDLRGLPVLDLERVDLPPERPG
jgi:dephospho-CoA kinase